MTERVGWVEQRETHCLQRNSDCDEFHFAQPILRVALAAVILLIGGPTALGEINFATYTYRYRMIVEVEVAGEIKSAASVIEVHLSRQRRFSSEVPPIATRVTGEAVFLDLGAGRNVIALLASGPFGGYLDYPQHVVPHQFKLSYADRDLEKFPRLKGRWDLDGKWLPTLVTFSDLNDPKSAHVVHPDEFERVFGPGIQFGRVWVEMTSDPVTRSIEQKMPMLTTYRDWLRRARSQPTKFTPQYNLFRRSQ